MPEPGPKTMLNDVYNRRILELAGSIPRIGRLETPDASATAHSKLCGSTVTVDLKMDGDTVTDFAHDVKACALGQASSSIMARNVVGAKADELRDLRENVRRMLKENGAPPAEGKWSDIAVLEPVRDYKARHASTLLTFDAVVDAINQIEAKRGAAPGKVDTGFPQKPDQNRAATKEAAPGKVDAGFPSSAAAAE
jgi:NifU-like protein involved in Fe-S cluster formation